MTKELEPFNMIFQEKATDVQEQFMKELFTIGAVRFGNFRLKLHDNHPEAPLSPVYIDLRMLRRFPAAKKLAVDLYQKLVSPLQFDLLADIPTAATSLVSSLADRLEIGMITPRTDHKKHGTGATIDGWRDKDRGKTAVLIDDVITQATSKLETIAILEKQGITVRDIVVLIDRKQGCREQLELKGYALHAGLTMSKLLDFYRNAGSISENHYHDIKQRLAQLDQFLKA